MVITFNTTSVVAGFEANKVYPKLENLEITPSGEIQKFTHENSYGYDEVIVHAVESEELTVTPSAEEQIVEGLFRKVSVSGESNYTEENIREGTTMWGKIGTLKPAWDSSQIKRWYQSFYNNTDITELPDIDFSGAETIYQMCYGCSNLVKAELRNTQNVNNMQQVFNNCKKLVTVGEVDASSAVYMSQFFNNCTNLENFGGFKNIGKAYTNKTTNHSFYTLTFTALTKLTHESLMNIINNLYDLNLTYDVQNRWNTV